MRIAMWSGPRNLSTAMMYSFASRSDVSVWDEPFYAAYLARTGLDHPMRSEILGKHEQDPQRVAQQCQEKTSVATQHFYMKHMAHHMVEGFPLGWAEVCTNVYLIRHPARVIASYLRKREKPTFEDLGFEQQLEIFERFPGPVIDSNDVLVKPEVALKGLCAEIGMTWDEAMLSWPAGGHDSDGVWSRHWYQAVHRSTGFAAAESFLPRVESPLLKEAMPYYLALDAHKLSFFDVGSAQREV